MLNIVIHLVVKEVDKQKRPAFMILSRGNFNLGVKSMIKGYKTPSISQRLPGSGLKGLYGTDLSPNKVTDIHLVVVVKYFQERNSTMKLLSAVLGLLYQCR